MTTPSDHKPITETELKEWETFMVVGYSPTSKMIGRLIAEVRRLQARLGADEPCDWPSCDGVVEASGCPHPHRHFKDGRWLDTNEEM